MQKTVDYAVVIGRFQPFHNGHKALIEKAISVANRKVVVLIGSPNAPRNIKNPFTYRERESTIRGEFGEDNIIIRPIADFQYNDQQWVMNVQKTITEVIRTDGWTDYPPTVGVVGLDKDSSTRYLNWFPQWEYFDGEQIDLKGIDATKIREILFDGKNIGFVTGVLPPTTLDNLSEYMRQPWWSNLEDEYKFIQDYKKQWANSPYPPVFVTTDAVVVQDGHILMVTRGANPGKGLLALPGGFVNSNEKIEDAVFRELREETRIKVPEPVLRGSVVAHDVFDAPDRSLRGRTITHAYLIKLASGKLAAVKGSDDAIKAQWIPLSDLKENEIFEDHYAIIMSFLGKI